MRLLTAAVVVTLALTAPVPAHADGVTFYGGCHLTIVTDPTSSGELGGNDGWDGAVDVAVVAKDLGPIRATCGIRINGVDQGTVLAAPERLAVTAATGRVHLMPPMPTDVVTLYTTVTTSSGTETCDTGGCSEMVICPYDRCGDGLLDPIYEIYETLKVLDPPSCALLVAAAPIVDSQPTSDLLYVDPDTGDTYVGGTAPEDLFWDCPPYVT